MLHLEGCHMKIVYLNFYCILNFTIYVYNTANYYHVSPNNNQEYQISHPVNQQQPSNTHNLPNIHQATPTIYPTSIKQHLYISSINVNHHP